MAPDKALNSRQGTSWLLGSLLKGGGGGRAAAAADGTCGVVTEGAPDQGVPQLAPSC